MLYQIGPLTFDTFPIEVGDAKRSTAADFAKHDLIGARKDYEFVGAGDDTLSLSGTVLPFRTGGLAQVGLAHELCRAGEPLFCMRGDGKVLGWRVILSVEENHESIMRDGVGFSVRYDIKLDRVDDPGPEAAAGQIATLLSLFG